ncbi:CPBP family intramembrane glutamic endopeptidase [Clostridium hydrogenum]|uniref:CPBP family intramembrane glutamic endopeptidase n=1 Tax=Clostridium hydrogenum TaxID=2855764 RepID=UPI001F359A7D|nr:type II CAAX endopeptidase family protein [Clostridium hydrogenum]
MSLRKLDKNFKIAIMTLILTVISAGIFGGFTLIMSKTKLELFNNGIVNTLILEIIVTIVPCLVVKINSGGKFNLELISMKFEGNSSSNLFIGMGISLFMITTLVVTLMVTRIISIKGFGFEFAPVNKVLWSVFLVFLVAIFAGICEEIFCRGILLNYLAKWKGEIFALIVSSIIFTAFHITRYQDINSLTNVFLMGIILGITFIVTKSLYMPIGLHFAWDFYLDLWSTEKDPSLFVVNLNNKFGINYIDKVDGWEQIIIKLIIIIIFIAIYIKIRNQAREVT